jgi:hypothetical protein
MTSNEGQFRLGFGSAWDDPNLRSVFGGAVTIANGPDRGIVIEVSLPVT